MKQTIVEQSYHDVALVESTFERELLELFCRILRLSQYGFDGLVCLDSRLIMKGGTC